MNKLTKRIMALMLSLVMIFGCVPSFINEVKANKGDTINITYTPPTTKVEANSFAYDNNVECKKNEDLISAWGIQLAYEPNFANYNIVYLEVQVSFNDDASRNNVTTLNLNGENIKTAENKISSNYEEYKEQMKDQDFGWYTKDNATDYSLVSVQKIVFSEPITEVNLTSTGVLATNVKTLKYEVANDAPYTLADDPTTNWYKADLTTTHDFSSIAEAYKKLVLTPSSGYKFTSETTVKLDGTGRVLNDKTTLNDDGTLTVFIETAIQSATISLDFEKPETYTELTNLVSNFGDGEGAKDKFTFVGEELDSFKSYRWHNEVANNDNNYLGYFLLESKYIFNNSSAGRYKETCESIAHIFYRNKYLTFKSIDSEITGSNLKGNTEIMNMKANDILCYKLIDDTTPQYIIYIYEKLDLRKSTSITIPTAEGTKIQDLIDSATITDSTGTAKLESSQGVRGIQVFALEDGQVKSKLNNNDLLEKDKEYYVKILVYDTEYLTNSSVKLNDTLISILSTNEVINHVQMHDNSYSVYYILSTKQPVSSGGSKKYKADDKDTAEKISGSGKKGSKRIITPQEGRKVESIIVTDKNGNKYEVTNEGDGTYSFIQPGTNVDVEVKYKNRLIELTIGSLDASVDDVNHKLDVVPKVVNDRTMLPIRFVAENLGAKVDWDEKDPDTVIITRGETKIEITLGSDIAKVNGQEYMLDSVAFAENDRTYLPVRFVSEKLNAIVEWNEEKPMDVKIYER